MNQDGFFVTKLYKLSNKKLDLAVAPAPEEGAEEGAEEEEEDEEDARLMPRSKAGKAAKGKAARPREEEAARPRGGKAAMSPASASKAAGDARRMQGQRPVKKVRR
jgi:hypothetical protein